MDTTVRLMRIDPNNAEPPHRIARSCGVVVPAVCDPILPIFPPQKPQISKASAHSVLGGSDPKPPAK